MAKVQTQTDISELARQTQELFKLNGASAPQFEQFREVQNAMLKEAETFAHHWFERRQEATDATIDAMRQVNSNDNTDPTAFTQAITDWQSRSFERLNADLQDWMTLCTHCAQLAAPKQEAGAGAPSDAGQRKRA